MRKQGIASFVTEEEQNMKNKAMDFITYAKSFTVTFHWSKQAYDQALTQFGQGMTMRAMTYSDQ